MRYKQLEYLGLAHLLCCIVLTLMEVTSIWTTRLAQLNLLGGKTITWEQGLVLTLNISLAQWLSALVRYHTKWAYWRVRGSIPALVDFFFLLLFIYIISDFLEVNDSKSLKSIHKCTSDLLGRGIEPGHGTKPCFAVWIVVLYRLKIIYWSARGQCEK